MPGIRTVLSFATLAIVTGCAGPKYSGTWQSASGEAVGDFALGGMTLSPDGTYTAYADYAGTTRGFSGVWTVQREGADEWLVFESPRPGQPAVRYRVRFDAEGDVLLVTDPQTGIQTRLVEVRGIADE